MLTEGRLLLERYRLVSRIAVGGMGEVWHATDERLERPVATKVLLDRLVGEASFLQRLRTEARNTARLWHPNVATLLDYGEEAGAGVLVMELVPGEPLSTVLRREGRLEPAQALPLLAQAAHGLHAAHVAGVVHRDIKPANLLVTGTGILKITDFGISHHSDQPRMTSDGMVMGTAQYLPPELALGRPASPAGDLYALGVIAFEMLAGRRPYVGDTAVDVAFAHVNEPVPPLPEHVPAAVAALVTQLLAKEPGARPRSGAALARSLERLTDDAEPAAAAPASPDPPAAVPAAPGDAEHAHPADDVRADAAAPEVPVPATDPGAGQRDRAASSPWRAPTWRELRADRAWSGAVVVGLTAVGLLALLWLGTLALAETSHDEPSGAVGTVVETPE